MLLCLIRSIYLLATPMPDAPVCMTLRFDLLMSLAVDDKANL